MAADTYCSSHGNNGILSKNYPAALAGAFEFPSFTSMESCISNRFPTCKFDKLKNLGMWDRRQVSMLYLLYVFVDTVCFEI